MKSVKDIKQSIRKLQVESRDEIHGRVLDKLLRVLDKSKRQTAVKQANIWRMIMRSRITKLAAAAVIIITVFIGINHFVGSIDGTSIAFGEVLGYIQTSSYNFDLTGVPITEEQPSEAFTIQAMVLELGRLRLDCSAPKISSITDFNTGKCLLIFHQKKAGVLMENLVIKNMKTEDGIGGIYALFSRPIENLWNLQDGTQENLGEKQIDGQRVTGFRVFQKDPYFEYDITIWANKTTGVPILVEVLPKPLDTSHPSIKWIMNNFILDVEPDEKLFNLEVPEGYTLSQQWDLDELQPDAEPSAEAKKIVEMLELWPRGQKTKAVEILLGLDWAQPLEFGNEPYIFSITEKAYISLKFEDQKRI
ncbi:MAG: hypothetical protein ACYSW3_15810 [Planctomycetota bacterium]|jgi:hypothetical protein